METKRKKCQVIMLPTKEVLKNGLQPISAYNKPINKSGLIFPTTGAYARRLVKLGNQAYHLYVVSDEEIKNEDWVYDPIGNRITRIYNPGPKETNLGAKKIIATTDSSLKIGNPRCEFDDNKVLPQPSKAFVEKYCKLGGIDEVMVEFNTYPIGPNGNIIGTNKTYPYKGLVSNFTINYIPKVNSHNEITIHPIKDSWTKEEIVDALSKSCVMKGVIDQLKFEEILKL